MTDILTEIAQSTPYAPAAFEFVERGLSHTVTKLHGESAIQIDAQSGHAAKMEAIAQPVSEQTPRHRHITGQQLCHGLRDYAIGQYGLLARTVLKRWGITRCEDFGQIVYILIEHDLMQKTENDRLEDFFDVFDFRTAFDPELPLGE